MSELATAQYVEWRITDLDGTDGTAANPTIMRAHVLKPGETTPDVYDWPAHTNNWTEITTGKDYEFRLELTEPGVWKVRLESIDIGSRVLAGHESTFTVEASVVIGL